MPNLALITEHYGRIGNIETILPEFVMGMDEFGGRVSCWPSAIGMVRIGTIDKRVETEITPQLLSSIIITREDKGKPIDVTELHGVMLFRPLDGLKWHDQISSIKTHPTLFEVVPVSAIEAGKDYAFFARRAARTARAKRKVLE